MKRKIPWLVLSCLMVVALVLSSCQAATVEEEKETETVAGKVIEKETAEVEEEEEAAVVVAEGAEMVRDPTTGKMVEKPRYGGTITYRDDNDPGDGLFDPWESGKNMTAGSIYGILHGGDWGIDRGVQDFKTNYPPVEHGTGYSMTHFENPDPLTYIIYLREGMRFHDKEPVFGREVTADDFKYSIDRYLGLGEFTEDGPSPWVHMPGWRDYVADVEVIDKYTISIHLNQEAALFTEFWGQGPSPFIIPREVVDTYGNEFSWEHVAGHGAWMVEDYVPGSGVTFEAHPNYYQSDAKYPENRIPYADNFKVLIIPDWSTTMAAMRTGKIDYLPLGWEDALALQDTDPHLKYVQTPGTCAVIDLRVDPEQPYSDIRVRKAMQMAIDLDAIAETLYGGTADPYPMMVSPVVHYDYWTPLEELPGDCAEAFTYNPERARELLAEAGFPSGFKQTMPMSAQSDLADVFIAQWEDIGIETEINLMESAAYSAHVTGGKAQMAWIFSCGTWEPQQILYFWYGGQKPGNRCN